MTVDVCSDLSGSCLDIFDTGNGKLFTNSPSVTYLDSIGGSPTNRVSSENGTKGPVGDFYAYDWTNSNALCNTYNTRSVGGRTNWRLATKDELATELYDVLGDMFVARGWPTTSYYWSATPDVQPNYYYRVHLRDRLTTSAVEGIETYASCVSNP